MDTRQVFLAFNGALAHSARKGDKEIVWKNVNGYILPLPQWHFQARSRHNLEGIDRVYASPVSNAKYASQKVKQNRPLASPSSGHDVIFTQCLADCNGARVKETELYLLFVWVVSDVSSDDKWKAVDGKELTYLEKQKPISAFLLWAARSHSNATNTLVLWVTDMPSFPERDDEVCWFTGLFIPA